MRDGAQWQHTEKGDEGRSERGCLGVLDKVWGSEGVWVFRLSQTVHFAPFFFFWISAWLGRFGRYRPIRPIRTESARFGLRQRWFQPRRPDSGIATWHDAARTRGLRRPAASDAGALAWEPRPCIPGQHKTLHVGILSCFLKTTVPDKNSWGLYQSNPPEKNAINITDTNNLFYKYFILWRLFL